MAGLNFKLTDKDIFEDNPEFKLIDHFKSLTDRQMKYVMYVDWLGSPYRLMALEDRKLKSALKVGYKLDKLTGKPDSTCRNVINGKVATIEAARKEMTIIQYDPNVDLKDALDSQINQITEFLKRPEKTPTEMDKAVNYIKSLPILLKSREEILGILNFKEPVAVSIDKVDPKEESVTSYLDEHIDNL